MVEHYLHVQYDDWCGVYDQYTLVYEGHSCPISQLVKSIRAEDPFTLDHKNAEGTELAAYVRSQGELPNSTAEARKLLSVEEGEG